MQPQQPKIWHDRVPWQSLMEPIQDHEIPDDITKLLEHNEPLEEQDVQLVKSFREQRVERLNAIENEVRDLEQVIEAYQHRCSQLELELDPRRKEIVACDVALSVIRRLPTDIIQDIALLCLPDKPSGHIRDAPLALSQVSSTWRKAVLRLPRIWSEVHVHLAPGFDTKSTSFFLTEYLKRARNHPLNLHILFHRPRRPRQWERRALEEAVQGFLNWMFFTWELISKVAQLHLTTEFDWDEVFKLPNRPADLNMLQTLVLRASGNGSGMSIDLMSILEQATSLRKVVLQRTALEPDIKRAMIPWWNLTDLVMDEVIYADEYVFLLDKCANLQRAHFTVSENYLHNISTSNDHGHLIDLSLRFDTVTPSSMEFLRHRKFPKLSVLRLDLEWTNGIIEQPYDLGASMPELRSLHISTYRSASLPIGPFLGENTQITHLHLVAKPTEVKFVTSLFWLRKSDVHQPILPHLSTATIGLIDGSTTSSYISKSKAKSLIDMVRSRTQASLDQLGLDVSPLSAIHFIADVEPSFEEDFRQRLNQLHLEGVDCRVESASKSDDEHSAALAPFSIQRWL
ncbi:hypothetical protein CPB83DRAFT_898551 [Crepidotus variabilis]|uniref:F-box domain-containing protein n=1 Tax=Crepidotus variabilis TaxID=179855 RepID=A0A9P6JKD2_9AGAR|nr:hypothetical protein CPB83DRAFT_898551 [Crepidotus variabilis]